MTAKKQNKQNSYVKKMNKAKSSHSVVVNDIIQNYNKNNDIYIITEGGGDIKYYKNIISKRYNSHIVYKPAKGKPSVLKVYGHIFKNQYFAYDKKRILFLVDKDFSYWNNLVGERPDLNDVNDTNIYITDHYSIENNLIEYSMFNKILISNNYNQFSKTYFDTLLSNFRNSMKEVMADSILLDRAKQKKKINFSIPNDTMIDINNLNVTVKYSIQSSQTDVNEQIKKFNNKKSEYSVKGKLELEFLFEILKTLGINFKYKPKKYKNIKDMLFYYFIKYATIPHSLKTFLDSFLTKKIN